MNIVEHSKCIKCGKTRHASELMVSSTGTGFSCNDSVECKKEKEKREPMVKK